MFKIKKIIIILLTSVDTLHSLIGDLGTGALKLRHVLCCCVLVVLDVQSKLDHSVDSSRKGGRILVGESRADQGSFKQEPNEVLNIPIAGITLDFFPQLLNDGVVGVDLHGLLGHHIAGHVVVLKGLGLHDPLHIGRPAPLRGNQNTGRLSKSEAQLTFLNLLSENLLEVLAQGLVLGPLLLLLFLLILGLVELESLLGTVPQFLSLELLQLLDDVLIDRVCHVQNLEVPLFEGLEEGGVLDGLLALSSDEVDILLSLLHLIDILLQRDQVLPRLGGLVPEEAG